ncbi:hypothetical protein [Flammeovirga aprica]|uniref:Uncharacterized protein n=1 Tax=Flammeovirga aprica JL-4 TaxID=694437 RepID=A0A7X9RUJ4_9BACT|nr:hypothetical protein [Flammeovirga aprica]NME68988.1 hypothetical protein [Flammeovirga aprica JL-4]
MEINEVINRVKIERNKEVVEKVKRQLHRENNTKQLLSFSLKSLSIVILLACFHLANSLQVHQFITEEVNKAYINMRSNEKSRLITYSLESVALELKQGNYSGAREILNELPHSHHKDWFISLTSLGLKDFETSEQYLTKINAQDDHLYHSKLDYKFCMKYHIIQVRNFYDQEGEQYSRNISQK